MKIHKIEIMVIDFDEVGAGGIKDVIENTKYPNRCIAPEVLKIETRDFGLWTDDHPLNRRGTMEAEYQRIFSQP